jgi:pilus assembly protein CpaE
MKTLMITKNKQLHAEVAAQGAARIPSVQLVASRTGVCDAVERVLPEPPELVILDSSDIEPGEADLLERLARLYPAASFLLLTRRNQQRTLLRAMQTGMREVLLLPLVHKDFHEAMDRIDKQAGVTQAHKGKVLAFISGKGGSGATFISTNFGYALAVLAGKKVMLMDLNCQFGNAVRYVSNQKPRMALSNVCSQIEHIDGTFLASCLVQVSPNFGVLAAVNDVGHAVDMNPEQLGAILRVARRHYDYILLDVARPIDALSLCALDTADAIYAVLQLALPDIRAGRRLFDLFRSLGYSLKRMHLLVNRYEKGGNLHLSDVEQALGVAVAHALPNDYIAVTDSVNQGIPVLQLSRTSAVARSLIEMVELVTATRIAENKGLFGRLLGRAHGKQGGNLASDT